MKQVAEYADGIGRIIPYAGRGRLNEGNIKLTGMVQDAHQNKEW